MPYNNNANARASSASDRVAKSTDKLSARGRRTRAQLLEAAQRVFEHKGFVEVRVADIVEETGVAHGTFYTYFNSKEEIFRAVIEVHQSTIERAAAGATLPHPSSARARIEASNRAYIEGYAQHSRLMERWQEASVLHADLAELLEELILYNIRRTERFLWDLKNADVIAPDVDPTYAAKALNAMVMQFSIRIFKGGAEEVDIDKAVRTITDIWCRGIGLDESR